MVQPYYFNYFDENRFLNAIKVFFEDIKKRDEEQEKLKDVYVATPHPDNPALYQAGAKHTETMLLLGICAEYLIKIILIKHNCIINKISQKLKFDDEFIKELDKLRKEGAYPNSEQVKKVSELSEKNIIGSISEKTFSFNDCIKIFNKEIVSKSSNYFPNYEYPISNDMTKRFYGEKITYDNAFIILRNLRNNYGHIPEAQSEEQGILPFLFDFLVFVCKKEFPEFFKDLKNFGR